MEGVNLELTAWQASQLRTLFDRAKHEYDKGNPAGLLAQVWDSPGGGLPFMEVRLVDPEACKKIQEATGQEPGKVSSSVTTVLCPEESV
ncbi:MAG TPA: hypothetical protein DHV36_09545 [Desulfobacteraceae bacterium]|nr:hypothetical protein [Desulfobacteraceae bacterium]